jgi:hypothetical protein
LASSYLFNYLPSESVAQRRIFASVTAEEKEGEGGRRRKRRRGRKKERERRKRRKEEGRRGGVHSPTRFQYSICGVKSCASFSVTTRCRCYCFPSRMYQCREVTRSKFFSHSFSLSSSFLFLFPFLFLPLSSGLELVT